jgi:methionyl-tRNA formyltransferase
MIVVAYGLIIPQNILNLPKNGCLNIHCSLLPKWRGAAPIQRSLLAGDEETGITIIQMNAGLDTGDILYKQSILVDCHETTKSLYEKMLPVSESSISFVINNYSILNPEKQNNNESSYAEKIIKEETRINWGESVEVIERKIRGYNPVPGAFTIFNDKIFKIWDSFILNKGNHNFKPGTFIINKKEFVVYCGSGILSLKEVQLAGSKRLEIKSFLAGCQTIQETRCFSSLQS